MTMARPRSNLLCAEEAIWERFVEAHPGVAAGLEGKQVAAMARAILEISAKLVS